MKPNFRIKPLVEVWSPQEAGTVFEERADAAGEKQLWLSTIVQRADAKNRNGRVYPRHVLEREMGKFRDHIKAGTSYGEADHPEPGKAPSVLRQAVLWKEIGMDEQGVMRARGIVMDTFAGQQVKGIHKAGGAIGSSSRGRGTVSLKSESGGGEQREVVNDDYQMRTFDLVIDQSVPEAESRLFQYEQQLIEQENPFMKLTLDELKSQHPEAYAELLAEAKKLTASGSDSEVQKKVEALFAEKEDELRERFQSEMEESGLLLDAAKAKRFAQNEAFVTCVIEAARESGVLEGLTLTDEEAQTKIEALTTEVADLRKKVGLLEAANAKLAEKTSESDVATAAKKLAENHALSTELEATLIEQCSDMDEFKARSGKIKERFDGMAKRVGVEPGETRTGHDLTEGEEKNPKPRKPADAPVLSEQKKRIASLGGVGAR